MTNLEPGQKVLLDDMQNIMSEIERGEFGDFTNSTYSVPKMALVNKLHEVINNVINGKYD